MKILFIIIFHYPFLRNTIIFSFAEYLIRERLIVGDGTEHPVFVFQMTPRFYFMSKEILSGPFAGIITGFTLKRKNTDETQGVLVGIEPGYKFLLGKKKVFFLEPKILLIHNFSEPKSLIPGFEIHIGIRF